MLGLLFYLLLLLRARLSTERWFDSQGIKSPNLANSLDLVALGTIADLVPLDYNNRILAEHGLARIRAGRCRPGIIALLAGAGKNHANTVSQDLGFIVAPRLNAAGRMEDISTGIECLIANNANHANKTSGRTGKN